MVVGVKDSICTAWQQGTSERISSYSAYTKCNSHKSNVTGDKYNEITIAAGAAAYHTSRQLITT